MQYDSKFFVWFHLARQFLTRNFRGPWEAPLWKNFISSQRFVSPFHVWEPHCNSSWEVIHLGWLLPLSWMLYIHLHLRIHSGWQDKTDGNLMDSSRHIGCISHLGVTAVVLHQQRFSTIRTTRRPSVLYRFQLAIQKGSHFDSQKGLNVNA